jgi:hypothetical protein
VLREERGEKERIGKEKAVKMNGKEETENENKPEKSQNKKYKTATKTMNLYMASSLFLLPSSLFYLSTVNSSQLSTAFLLSCFPAFGVNCQLLTVNCSFS